MELTNLLNNLNKKRLVPSQMTLRRNLVLIPTTTHQYFQFNNISKYCIMKVNMSKYMTTGHLSSKAIPKIYV